MTTKDKEKTDRFVTLDVFRTLEDAQILRSRLGAEGISVLIPREGMASPLASDVSILVHASELEHAKEILESVRRGEFALGDDFKIHPSAPTGPVLPPKNDDAANNHDRAEGSRPEVTILIGGHLAASAISAFTLLSQMRWDLQDMSRRSSQWTVAIIALAAIWPYIVSWLSCRASMTSRFRTWIFIGVLAFGAAVADIGYIELFSLYGWTAIAGITVGQAAIYIIAASLVLDSTSASGRF